MKKINIKPLSDRVVIKELSEEERATKTKSGIYIPETADQDRGAKHGEVVAVGPGRIEDGKNVPVNVKVGDEVLFQWGDKVKIGNDEYTIVSESSILAVIK